jgi:hypothetical protein
MMCDRSRRGRIKVTVAGGVGRVLARANWFAYVGIFIVAVVVFVLWRMRLL